MNIGDIVIYKHTERQSLYGVISSGHPEDINKVRVSLHTPNGFREWADDFPCRIEKLTVLESVA